MRRWVAAGLVTVGIAAGLVACAGSSDPDPAPPAKPSTTAPPTKTVTPAPTSTPTPTPTQTPVPEQWQRFTDDRIAQSFEVPPGWAVVEQPSASAESGIVQFQVNDVQGKLQLYFASSVSGLGGSCGNAPALVVEELDAEPATIPGYTPLANPPATLAAPRFVYRAMQTSQGVVASLALTDEQLPPDCFQYNVLNPAAGPMVFADAVQVSAEYPPRLFASMDETKAYMQTDEYQTLKRILLSLRIGV